MSRWLLDGSELCMPLCDCLLNQIQPGELLNMDETRLQVLPEESRANTTNSHLWYMVGGRDGLVDIFTTVSVEVDRSLPA